jgi:lipoate-protein ligase A
LVQVYNSLMPNTNTIPWRLILSPPTAGAFNMAIDEAILESVADGTSPPTMRLYAWDPACLSLGYAQPYSDVDHLRLQNLGWDLVRRSSGGRAILHTEELTYALIAPIENPHFAGGVLESYRHLSQGLAAALSSMGLVPETKSQDSAEDDSPVSPICFQIPSVYEITIERKKLIGSAQVRRRAAVLQHGSLPLQGDITRVCKVLSFPSEEQREKAVIKLASSAATLASLLREPPTWSDAADAVIKGFTDALEFAFERGELSDMETRRVEELVTSRFANQAWLNRR